MKDGGLREIFRKRLPEGQWTSIESPLTGSGIPDAEYCFPGGKSGWVEFKKTDTMTVPHLRPFQVSWIEQRSRLGGRVFVAVRRVVVKKSVDELWLIDGRDVRQIIERGLTAPFMLFKLWQDGPEYWDWRAIKKMLSEG